MQMLVSLTDTSSLLMLEAANARPRFTISLRRSNPKSSAIYKLAGRLPHLLAVRPEGANHQWRKNPPGELSIDPVADGRLVPG
jgi:hypothetical protein